MNEDVSPIENGDVPLFCAFPAGTLYILIGSFISWSANSQLVHGSIPLP